MGHSDENPSTNPFTPFSWESRPSSKTWIKQLSAADAKVQCLAWGLDPKPTLEANRALLSEFVDAGTPPGAASSPPGPDQPDLSSAAAQMAEHLILKTAAAVGQQIAAALSASSKPQQTTDSTRIPNVVVDLIQALPNVSGTNVRQLLNFLARLRSIFDLRLTSDDLVIQNTLSKTQGQLRTVWSTAITAGSDSASLVRQVLDTFLPGPVRHQALTQHLFRVQRPKEPLGEFFSELRSFAGILVPDMPDAELVDTLLTHMNPQCRARLAGFPYPSSSCDLFQLVPRIEAIRATEGDYYGQYGAPNGGPIDHQRAYHHSNYYGAQPYANGPEFQQPQYVPEPRQPPPTNHFWHPPPAPQWNSPPQFYQQPQQGNPTNHPQQYFDHKGNRADSRHSRNQRDLNYRRGR